MKKKSLAIILLAALIIAVFGIAAVMNGKAAAPAESGTSMPVVAHRIDESTYRAWMFFAIPPVAPCGRGGCN